MEAQFVSWVFSALLGLFVYLLKRTVDGYDNRLHEQEGKLREQDKAIAEIRRDYLHRDDFKEFKLELRSMFDEIKADIREIKNK